MLGPKTTKDHLLNPYTISGDKPSSSHTITRCSEPLTVDTNPTAAVLTQIKKCLTSPSTTDTDTPHTDDDTGYTNIQNVQKEGR